MVIRIIKKGNSTQEKEVPVTLPAKTIRVIKKKRLTLRQQAVVAEVAKGSKSKAAILRKAGYSEAVVHQPHKVFDQPDVQEAIAPILDRLVAHRDRVLARMEALVGKAGYTSLSITLANMNKDIELLSGRPTDRTQYTLPPEEQERLRKLLELNS